MALMDERPRPPLPRAPGAQWPEIDSLSDLRVVAEDWFRNPTPLDWEEIRFVMDGIRRVSAETTTKTGAYDPVEVDRLIAEARELVSLIRAPLTDTRTAAYVAQRLGPINRAIDRYDAMADALEAAREEIRRARLTRLTPEEHGELCRARDAVEEMRRLGVRVEHASPLDGCVAVLTRLVALMKPGPGPEPGPSPESTPP